ncbi:unnamed protein product [Blepharisma stoltei]|uniref:Uncharacterized protein n=1 Tax=Blepharisma stoltei TaxID=1481888 RepID=A0AAU9K4Z5_9CILI|nr:unnamed protein product [Blepharisma stoltei]
MSCNAESEIGADQCSEYSVPSTRASLETNEDCGCWQYSENIPLVYPQNPEDCIELYTPISLDKINKIEQRNKKLKDLIENFDQEIFVYSRDDFSLQQEPILLGNPFESTFHRRRSAVLMERLDSL